MINVTMAANTEQPSQRHCWGSVCLMTKYGNDARNELLGNGTIGFLVEKDSVVGVARLSCALPYFMMHMDLGDVSLCVRRAVAALRRCERSVTAWARSNCLEQWSY